ncbi:hypothetical protein C8J56DRAFT_901624 [Mycena floridula]|nr:hypothetical protein C8J56DRAFT_901624 [Mycena floridula]
MHDTGAQISARRRSLTHPNQPVPAALILTQDSHNSTLTDEKHVQENVGVTQKPGPGEGPKCRILKQGSVPLCGYDYPVFRCRVYRSALRKSSEAFGDVVQQNALWNLDPTQNDELPGCLRLQQIPSSNQYIHKSMLHAFGAQRCGTMLESHALLAVLFIYMGSQAYWPYWAGPRHFSKCGLEPTLQTKTFSEAEGRGQTYMLSLRTWFINDSEAQSLVWCAKDRQNTVPWKVHQIARRYGLVTVAVTHPRIYGDGRQPQEICIRISFKISGVLAGLQRSFGSSKDWVTLLGHTRDIRVTARHCWTRLDAADVAAGCIAATGFRESLGFQNRRVSRLLEKRESS